MHRIVRELVKMIKKSYKQKSYIVLYNNPVDELTDHLIGLSNCCILACQECAHLKIVLQVNHHSSTMRESLKCLLISSGREHAELGCR